MNMNVFDESMNHLNNCVCHGRALLPAAQACRRALGTGSGRPGGVVVYEGALARQIRAVRVFSLATSATSVAAQPFLLKEVASLGSVPAVVALLGMVGFFTVVTPVLLHLVTRKYVTELRYDARSNEYTAAVFSFLLRKKLITFTPEDVTVPDVPGMFSTFKAKGVPLLVDPKLFEDPEHFVKIMGYDKPIDFRMKSDDDRTSPK
ncbi:transmembrane protein 70 homolog, mitochondrial isoform X2 [Bacillus rossius redtenbacheri]|uniref:transmembrane protein 70 homolog, mitochondrial isoform X2 n=1 Tax=Bacillus rossius redtenbacheri TaxID=93214 RepID=UPI002FDC8983